MQEWTLTKTKLQAGVWEGLITDATAEPNIRVTHLDRPIGQTKLRQVEGDHSWLLQVPIPPEAISDGVQTLLISDAETDTVVEKITLIAGDALGDDLRAEVDLLRAELDMLKRAFRRHCLETT